MRKSVFARLTSLLDLLGSLWILLLVALVTADVIGRYFFDRPITGVPEMMSLSIVGIVFLQLAHTLRVGRFIRSDVLLNRLTHRSPRAGALLDAAHQAAGFAMVAILAWFMYPRLHDSWTNAESVGDYGLFSAPVWPIDLIIMVGAVLTAVQFLLNAIRLVSGSPAVETDRSI